MSFNSVLGAGCNAGANAVATPPNSGPTVMERMYGPRWAQFVAEWPTIPLSVVEPTTPEGGRPIGPPRKGPYAVRARS